MSQVKFIAKDPVEPWFETLEDMGEFIGIRFGRLNPDGELLEWVFRPHKVYDGIGAFAEIFRERGVMLEQLPRITHPAPVSWLPLIRATPKFVGPRTPLVWGAIEQGEPSRGPEVGPPKAVAWHLFTLEQTAAMRRACRTLGVTVNSFLMKHLDKAIRPSLSDPSEAIPWMIPVNLRGKVAQQRDTANHSSYVAIRVQPYDTPQDIHAGIHRRLRKGEHWANWKSYELTRSLPGSLKVALIERNRAMSQWNIGSFSNLGVWDSECAIQENYCTTPWVFAPPVLRCQLLGAGAVTFQNRLGLMLQAHPELSTSEDLAAFWVYRWVSEINYSLPR